MKKITFICLLGILTSFIFAEAKITKDQNFTFYIGSGVTQLDGRPVISLDGSLSYALYPWLDVGIAGAAFHTLEREYKDNLNKTYQAESGYSELFIAPHWSVSKKLDLGVRLGLGMQLVQFRYEESLRDDLIWTEEILDKIEIPMESISVTAEYNLCPIHSIYLDLGYRNLKDTKTSFTQEGNLNGGFFGKIQYGFRF